MRNLSMIAVCLSMVVGTVVGQTYYVNVPDTPLTGWAAYDPSQLYPAGAGPITPGVPELAAPYVFATSAACAWSGLPPCTVIPQKNMELYRGGLAVDYSIANGLPLFYSTDGTNLHVFFHPNYVGGPQVGTCIGWPVTPLALVSGLAYDSSADILYYVDMRNNLYSWNTVTNVRTGPTALALADAATGLGHETPIGGPGTGPGLLYLVTARGFVYSISLGVPTPFGTATLLAAAPPPQACGTQDACWSGLDVDNSNGPAAPAQPACVTPGSGFGGAFHIAITDGVRIIDPFAPAAGQITLSNCAGRGPQNGVYGLAHSPDIQVRWALGPLGAQTPSPATAQVALPYSTINNNPPGFNVITFTSPLGDPINIFTHAVGCALNPPVPGGFSNLFLQHLPNPGIVFFGTVGSGVPNGIPPTPVGTSLMVQCISAFGIVTDAILLRTSW